MSYRTELIKNVGGRPPLYKTPEDLWAKFVEYVEFVDKHPIELPTTIVKGSHREEGRGGKVARSLTLDGFCVFANIARKWTDYCNDQIARNEGFRDVITRIRTCVRADQVEGGLAGVYNSNLTARLNGLTDRKDVTSGGKPVDNIVRVVDGRGNEI